MEESGTATDATASASPSAGGGASATATNVGLGAAAANDFYQLNPALHQLQMAEDDGDGEPMDFDFL